MKLCFVLALTVLLTGFVTAEDGEVNNDPRNANFVIQDDITVRQFADVHLHLNYDISSPESCKLYGPDGEDRTLQAEADELHPNSCGFIIRSVNSGHDGQWIIEYAVVGGQRRGSVNIHVLASQPTAISNLMWNVGKPVDIAVGPDDAVYCKIDDNNGRTVFENFGKCRIALDRVTVAHRGAWRMSVGLPGTVQLQNVGFNVEVLERGNKPVVTTSVATNKPSVLLTCSLPSTFEVNACKFRDPQNNILIAAHSVGQGGYAFNGSFVDYESSAGNNDCTLRLLNPTARDLGLWRCGMDTASGTFYGYMLVLCPFTMRDPEVAATVITEPVLAAERTEVAQLESQPVEMRCFIPAHVKYCYFRARNGSIFNVFPGMSTSGNFEYVGSGLDAGECGIRFRSMSASESGIWSCHVGLEDTSEPEQRQSISVHVRAQLSAQMTWLGTQAIVQATVSSPDTIDYCRFVMMNGNGFTLDNLPDAFSVHTSTNTVCAILIRNPTIIDLHPWAVAVKLTGQDGEVSASTGHLLGGAPQPEDVVTSAGRNVFFWLFIAMICLIPLFCAMAFISKKNRKWTAKRASNLGNSFRNSWDNTFHKQPTTTETQARV